MARICGVTQAAVWKWMKKRRPLPAEHVLVAEAQTGVSRHDLRPDIYPRDAGAPAIPPHGSVVVSDATAVACDRGAAPHSYGAGA